MGDIILTNEELTKVTQEALPKLLKETFSKAYGNPLKNTLDIVLNSQEIQDKLKGILNNILDDMSKDPEFNVSIRETFYSAIRDYIIKIPTHK